ncbi:hypothetical protein V1525DRAFT_432370 [Lipomyces kononenkoae]|uniref:Uncharacterized protein n=1 Tax=Lipomyces kononenkoae TaxID=34357 RepID=A0ACC3T2Q5_LIPKO
MQDAGAEITRCICGHDELQTDDPEIDSGLFIQCDKCQVWQHAYCVGIGPDDNLTDDYSCEKCRPELHLVVVRPTGKTSKYIPLLEAKQSRPTKERSASRHSSRSDQSSARRSNQSSSSAANSEASHKRRSTLNSRDSAYEEVLRRVLEVSAHEISGGPAGSDNETTKSGRSMRGKKRAAQTAFEDDDQDEDFKREDDNDDEGETHQHRRRRRTNGTKHTLDDDDSRSSEDMKKYEKRMKDESTENGIDEEDGDDNNDVDDEGEEDISDDVIARQSHRNGHKISSIGNRDRSRRSRVTQSPTETADENSSSRRSRNGRTASSSKKNSRSNGSPDENDDADEDAESEGNSKSRASPDDLPSVIATGVATPDEKPVSVNRKDTEEDELSKASTRDKPSPATTSNYSQSRNRRSRKQQTTVDRDDDTDTSTATGRAGSIGVVVEKPSKPRIPQGKSSIMEMRKRVAAILEFIGRTQVDMAIEQDERRKLHLQRRKLASAPTLSISASTTVTTNDSAVSDDDVVDTLFGTQKISLEMMDGLTRKLLIWEQQFGRHGDKS